MANLKPQMGLPGTQQSGLSGPSRFLITAAAFVIIVAGMKAAVDIIIPFLLSVFLAIISTPALFWLKSRGISTVFAILLVSLVILLAGLLMGAILTASIADFTQDLPIYTAKLNAELTRLEEKWNGWMTRIKGDFKFNSDNEKVEKTIAPPPEQVEPEPEEKPGFTFTGILDAQAGIKLMRDLLSQFGSLLTSGFMIYLTTIFILLEMSILPNKIRTVMKKNPEAFENLSSIAKDVKRYLAVKTVISLATGLLVAVWLTILHVKYPILWGLIAFLLNFVPNIGSIVAAIPACILAFMQLGFGSAVLTALGYMVINVSIGNIIEPRVMGQRMGLSTLVVFLSLVFWGWVLGPMGMLLSVPLTMAVKIVLESHPDTRKLSILLGSQNPPAAIRKSSSK